MDGDRFERHFARGVGGGETLGCESRRDGGGRARSAVENVSRRDASQPTAGHAAGQSDDLDLRRGALCPVARGALSVHRQQPAHQSGASRAGQVEKRSLFEDGDCKSINLVCDTPHQCGRYRRLAGHRAEKGDHQGKARTDPRSRRSVLCNAEMKVAFGRVSCPAVSV